MPAVAERHRLDWFVEATGRHLLRLRRRPSLWQSTGLTPTGAWEARWWVSRPSRPRNSVREQTNPGLRSLLTEPPGGVFVGGPAERVRGETPAAARLGAMERQLSPAADMSWHCRQSATEARNLV
jgi:hypothetical protein